MLQTGTLYSIVNNESSIESKEPIPNVYIYFSQNNVRKLTTKTDAQGKFSFDLPLGSYQVTVSQGATSQVYQLAGGAPFELTSASKQGAFEEWVLAPIYLKPEENPLVVLMNNLVLDARTSATEAKAGADRAEQAVSDTVGTGKIMREGVGGILVKTISTKQFTTKEDWLNVKTGENYFLGLESIYVPFKFFWHLNVLGVRNIASKPIFLLSAYQGSKRFFGHLDEKNDVVFNEIYTTANTTVDSNGFIKAASPIIKLFNDRIEANDSFKGEPEFKKVDTGVYQISGTLGLAKEGWYIEIPRDRNGFPYFLVEWEQDENNVVTIRTFKRKIDLETLDFVNGEPVDIGEDQRWIDLRFHEEETDDEELHSQLDNLDESAH